MKRRLKSSTLAYGAALACTLAGCRSPTQITFQITTNVDCSQITDTSFTSGPLAVLTNPPAATAVAPGCESAEKIGSVVVVPSGDEGAEIGVTITTGIGVEPDQCGPTSRCITAKRALRFIPSTPLVVNVAMNAACEGVVCAGDQTCDNGQCVSAIIGDPSQCEGTGCGDEVLDGGGASTDGAIPDATVPDATLPDAALPDASTLDSATDAPAGDANTADATPPIDATVTPASIGVGYETSCALMAQGTVECWGSNLYGGLGDDGGDDQLAPVPQLVPSFAHVVALTQGPDHACAVLEGGVVECWGYGGDGQLGMDNSQQASPEPIVHLMYEDGGAMRDIAAGYNHTCSVSADDVSVWCWGYWASASDDDLANTDPRYEFSLDAGISQISAGYAFTCALDVTGRVWCWGQNIQGALGQGSTMALDASTGAAAVLLALPPAVQICADASQACAVTTAHELYCWGDDSLQALGPIDEPDGGAIQSPVRIPVEVGHVVGVGCGDNHTCALFDDGGVACWGYDYDDELGYPNQVSTEFPQSVTNLGPVSRLFVGSESACAIRTNGQVACWGNDSNGQLGAGEDAAAAVPGPSGAQTVTLQ